MELSLLQVIKELPSHSRSKELLNILSGETGVSSSGFPFISDDSFKQFRDNIPLLFKDGLAVLHFLNGIERKLTSIDCTAEQLESIGRAIKVLRTIVYTACVTSTPDLWILRQILGTHKEIGILSHLLGGSEIEVKYYSEKNGLNADQLSTDLHFLYSRGCLVESDRGFAIKDSPLVHELFKEIEEIPDLFKVNMVNKITDWFYGEKTEEKLIRSFLKTDLPYKPIKDWVAGITQVELGYRLLPLVLGFRVAGLTDKLNKGASIDEQIPMMLPEMAMLLTQGGMLDDGIVTELGARVFNRGPGPFGIISAYHPYMNQLRELLAEDDAKVWVRRGANVAASQDANAKTFKVGNDSLNRFREKYDFEFEVFIEHAVGQGEATRQRFLLDGEDTIKYIGADLEDAAIDKAIEQQEMGLLPQNMQFIRGADIGDPGKAIQFLEENELNGKPSVMMVGNGFHEIRQQTNERMVEVFQKYQEAGLVLIFTEESALNDEDLLYTAWNTYHAGFRYVHQISGQGLRPAIDRGHKSILWSWRKCIRRSGYHLLEDYSYRSRSIYPFKSSREENPSISVTYFCVPEIVFRSLGLKTS